MLSAQGSDERHCAAEDASPTQAALDCGDGEKGCSHACDRRQSGFIDFGIIALPFARQLLVKTTSTQ
jgi:hypothetical protein